MHETDSGNSSILTMSSTICFRCATYGTRSSRMNAFVQQDLISATPRVSRYSTRRLVCCTRYLYSQQKTKCVERCSDSCGGGGAPTRIAPSAVRLRLKGFFTNNDCVFVANVLAVKTEKCEF